MLKVEKPVSAAAVLLMISAMVSIALFLIILEQVTDRRRDRQFEQELAAWRDRLLNRYGRQREKVSNRSAAS